MSVGMLMIILMTKKDQDINIPFPLCKF